MNHDITDKVGQLILEDKLKIKIMKNGILELSSENIKSALVYGALWGLLSVLIEVQQAGSVFVLDWKILVDAGVLGFIAVFITLLKNMFTTNAGNFLGLVKVTPSQE